MPILCLRVAHAKTIQFSLVGPTCTCGAHCKKHPQRALSARCRGVAGKTAQLVHSCTIRTSVPSEYHARPRRGRPALLEAVKQLVNATIRNSENETARRANRLQSPG